MDFDKDYEEQPPQPQVEDMEIDAQNASYLDLRDDWEVQAYALLKNRVFQHTWHIDPDLLEKIGMDSEFNTIWHTLGWNKFVSVYELVSHPLTIQFLCTLHEVSDGITFRGASLGEDPLSQVTCIFTAFIVENPKKNTKPKTRQIFN